MRILQQRRQLESANRRLRRARRLYVRFCTPALMSCATNAVMDAMTRHMVERKLYAQPEGKPICWRSYRYTILRHLYRQHGSPGSHWSFWYQSLGYDHNFNKVRPARIA